LAKNGGPKAFERRKGDLKGRKDETEGIAAWRGSVGGNQKTKTTLKGRKKNSKRGEVSRTKE